MDIVPELKFGHVEKPQRGLGLDAMIVVQDAQNLVHVVDPAFASRPTGQDVTQGFGEGAGQPRMQRRRKAHLLYPGSYRLRYTAAQTTAEDGFIADALHLAIGWHAERKGDQAVVHERQTCLHPVGHRVAIFHPEILGQGSPFYGAPEHDVQVGVLVTRVARNQTLDQSRRKPALVLEVSPTPVARKAAIWLETPQLMVDQGGHGAQEQVSATDAVPGGVLLYLVPRSDALGGAE